MLNGHEQALTRRTLLKLSAAGLFGASASSWFDSLANWGRAAAREGVKHKSCILLWLDGGPSHTHMWDMKAQSEYKAIDTSVPGLQVCEYLPKVAQQMKHISLLRGMSTGEADHARARYLMHTGYRPGVGGIDYPSVGAIVSAELGQKDFELPNSVVVALAGNLFRNPPGAGYFGPLQRPVVIKDPATGIQDLKALTDLQNVARRTQLIEELDSDFQKDYRSAAIQAHQHGYQGVLRMLQSPKAKAFDLSLEPEAGRQLYGSSKFGEGCLLARRLVEAGMPFVEVGHPEFWDHHGGAATRHKPLIEEIDTPIAALIADLKDRGLLDSTLVVIMGEFGRSPIRGDGHYAQAWTTVLAGAGMKNGQAVGRTDAKGGTVSDRPISTPQFIATICKAVGIDHAKRPLGPGNRPIGLVDKFAAPVDELFA